MRTTFPSIDELLRPTSVLAAHSVSREVSPCMVTIVASHQCSSLPPCISLAGHKCNNFRGSIYMIFDYMDHDMTGLLARSQREGPPFSVPQIKCYMQQLLLGLALLETNKVIEGGCSVIATFSLSMFTCSHRGASPGRSLHGMWLLLFGWIL